MPDDYDTMREKVALEYGFALYRRYSEPEAAHFIGIHLDTLKDMRQKGKVPFVALGPRQIRYLGLHLADMMLKGDKWREAPQPEFKHGEVSAAGIPHR